MNEYHFRVRGSTAYEHEFHFDVPFPSVYQTVGPISEPLDVVDTIRAAMEALPGILDVTITTQNTVTEQYYPPVSND